MFSMFLCGRFFLPHKNLKTIDIIFNYLKCGGFSGTEISSVLCAPKKDQVHKFFLGDERNEKERK